MGITAFVVYARRPIAGMVARRVLTIPLTIPVKTLTSFAHRMEEVVYVPWQDWGHFATPIELPATSPCIHILQISPVTLHPLSSGNSNTLSSTECSRSRQRPRFNINATGLGLLTSFSKAAGAKQPFCTTSAVYGPRVLI